MAFVTITVEGGLFAADLLDRLAAKPEDLPGQRAADFGKAGQRMSEEIQTAFADAKNYWDVFDRRRETGKVSPFITTREKWIEPLLKQVLDFPDLSYHRATTEIGGRKYPLSHRAGPDPDAPPVHILGYDGNLDERGTGRMSPHGLVQELLNRSDALWGLVTNGLKLRLLRDNALVTRPSYVEFDLEAMFRGNQYSEFVILYRLLHRTRFPAGAADAHDCHLEEYYQLCIEEGGRVRERLRDGVECALRRLGTGFLHHPDSGTLCTALENGTLDEATYYRELLRLIYRLLFLMVAEERRLLLLDPADAEQARRQRIFADWYSITRLRDRAEGRLGRDPYPDLWQGLCQTFVCLRDEAAAAQLGLTVLDGDLFGETACLDLERAAIANEDLLAAVHALSTFEEAAGRRRRGPRRRVHYAALDVEELGSVYESLLDYHPQIDLAQPAFALVAGSERKSTGSYYTPPALVRELIESALVPVMEERVKQADGRPAQEAALLSLRICDPAAGSGHFLLAAARRIARRLAEIRSGEAEPPADAYRKALREVIRSCLYAVDKNPLAVDLCKVALWLEGHCAGLPLTFLDHRVRCGDSLVGVFDLRVLAEGIPDEAYKALEGDDKKVAAAARKANRSERKGRLFGWDAGAVLDRLAAKMRALAAEPDDTMAAVQAKQRHYEDLRRDDADMQAVQRAADLWTAAFFAPLTEARGCTCRRRVMSMRP